jgi:hypothetical protein
MQITTPIEAGSSPGDIAAKARGKARGTCDVVSAASIGGNPVELWRMQFLNCRPEPGSRRGFQDIIVPIRWFVPGSFPESGPYRRNVAIFGPPTRMAAPKSRDG